MPDGNPIQGSYTVPVVPYHQGNNAQFVRTIRVTGSLNNPLTLTGSYANNAAFMVMNTASVFISALNGTSYAGADFHTAGQNHQIYNIALSTVSASAAGDITILYNY
jgi:hypothetical protein